MVEKFHCQSGPQKNETLMRRELSRKQEGSKRQGKAREKLAKLLLKIANQRDKILKRIIDENRKFVCEKDG
ncbi:MAG: hypothetical protein ABGW77_00650 [Campylobacterales bacterium]